MNTVNGNTITAQMLSDIADRYQFESEQNRKGAIDKMNNNIFESTILDDLELIAASFSVKT